MLEIFEKLINEHGSSVILKERLELYSDKYGMLEDKLEISNQKNSILETESASLQKQLESAQIEIKELQEKFETVNESKKSSQLDEEKQNILKLLFSINRSTSISELTRHLQLEESLIQYYIDSLKERDLVGYGLLKINSPVTYCLSEQGRKHVVEVIGISI
jgi:hypothetical protein